MLGVWIAALALAAPTHDAESAKVLQDAARAHGLSLDAPPLELSFEFRGTPYQLVLDGSDVRYERTVSTNAGTRTDRLVGSHFESSRDGDPLLVGPKRANTWRRSLKSVADFATLPRPLFHDSVVATSLGRTPFAGGIWNTVEVRIHGEDHDDDVFRFWFDPGTHELELFAYTFHHGRGGVRIRTIAKRHVIDDVVLIDWISFGVDGPGHTLETAMAAYEQGTLPRLSRVALKNPTVRRTLPR